MKNAGITSRRVPHLALQGNAGNLAGAVLRDLDDSRPVLVMFTVVLAVVPPPRPRGRRRRRRPTSAAPPYQDTTSITRRAKLALKSSPSFSMHADIKLDASRLLQNCHR